MVERFAGSEEAQNKAINDKYNQRYRALTNDRDNSYQSLDREQGKIDKQLSTSRNQLGDDLRNLLQSTSTQIGMYGAGDSSANQMAAYGAADLANAQNGQITDQYNDQTGDIALSRSQTKKKFDDDNRELGLWKNEKLASIKNDFADQRNSYRNEMNRTRNEWNAARAAINNRDYTKDISDTNKSISATTDQIVREIKNAKTPTSTIKDLPQYSADGISKADLGNQITGPTMTQAQAMEYLAPSDKKKKDQVVY